MKSGREHRDRAHVERKILVTVVFITDLQHWISVDARLALRVLRMVLEINSDPSRGIGKPEKLKHELAGHWSRRVTDEHRLIYRLDREKIEILSARSHYA